MNNKIIAEQVTQVYNEGKLICFFGLLALGFYLRVTYQVVETTTLAIWALCFSMTLLLRGVSLTGFRNRYQFGFRIEFWLWSHVLISLIFGSTIACLVLQFNNSWPIQSQIAFWMITVSIIAVIFRSYSPLYITCLAFNLPVILAALYALATAGPDYTTIFILMLFYSTGVIVAALTAYRSNRDRIRNELLLVEANDRLKTLASRDPLTNLPNRRAFDDFFQTEWERNKRSASALSLLVIDVDFFKKYNDNYGHGAGDVCLVRLANCINGSLNRPADRVARVGGEEFVVLLPDTSISGSIEVAMRILERVRSMAITHEYSSVAGKLTVSIGVATIDPTDEAEPSTLFNLADEQLYIAKANGRNRYSCLYSADRNRHRNDDETSHGLTDTPARQGKENCRNTEN